MIGTISVYYELLYPSDTEYKAMNHFFYYKWFEVLWRHHSSSELEVMSSFPQVKDCSFTTTKRKKKNSNSYIFEAEACPCPLNSNLCFVKNLI